MFETFAGIGAQHKALLNQKIENIKVSKTCEWDARAVIAYALIHHKNAYEKQYKKWLETTENTINEKLELLDFSLNSKTIARIKSKPKQFKASLIAANITNKNIPNIKKVRGEDLKEIDIITYSFPCQGLSIANMGRAKGIQSSTSTSHLVWEISRILTEAKTRNIKLPKYLVMENVTALTGPRHIEDFKSWIKILEKIGYKTIHFKLNGLDFGSPQNRTRLFAISIRKNAFPKKIKKITDYQTWFVEKYGKKMKRKTFQKEVARIFADKKEFQDEIEKAIPKLTPSRIKMIEKSVNLDEIINGKATKLNTLTTKQDRIPNIGMIQVKNKKPGYCEKRMITPREAYKIMGFSDEDFDKVKPYIERKIINTESLYRQAGNSIVVPKLEAIFKFISDIEKGFYE